MKCLNTITLMLSAVAALGKDDNNELGRSDSVVTLETERQLGGSSSSSKSSKSGYIFAKSSKSHSSTKSSKSHSSAKSSKASHLSIRLESQEVYSNSKDSRDVELVEEMNLRAEEDEEVVTSQTQYLPNGGIVRDYTAATCIGIITSILLWN